MTFDEARAAYPSWAFNIYAFEPTGPVTLEVIDEKGEAFTFAGPTLQSALDRAFPAPAVIEPEETINAFE